MTQSVSHTTSGAPSHRIEDAAVGLLDELAPVAEGADEDNLRTENRILREQLSYVLAQAAYNHQVMCKHQAFDLEIVGASSFPQLIT
ncbi:MAG: hypothetical protein HYZ45_01865, partial [Burkholderiales bacterium]|nr:hypothetical protein [Burkholderiales bacterium]